MNCRTVLVLLLAIIYQSYAQTCSQQFLLPNINKDSVTLTNAFNGQQAANSYPYISRLFSSTPVIAYSISSIDIVSSGFFLNYYLDVIQQTFQISFYFDAANQTWSTVQVNIWITSYSNLIVRQDTLTNVNFGTTSTQVVSLSQYNTTLGSTPQHLVYLVGIYANITNNNLTVTASSGGVNPSFATILLATGGTTSLINATVTSVIFSPSNSQFLSYAGVVTYTSFQQEYLNLYNSFVPIYYSLVGMSGIVVSGSNARFYGYTTSINGTVLSMTAAPATALYEAITFSYLTIGLATAQICANCSNNYISEGSCLAVCPVDTYRHTYTDGGKACLSCPSVVGLKINDLADGCNCLPGYQVFTQHQCSRIPVLVNCTGQNELLNGTVCICSPGTYNISGLCSSCPSNTFYNGSACQQAQVVCNQPNTVLNSNGTQCICIDGYTNYSNLCRPTCPTNSTFNSSTLACQCSVNYMNISGSCTPCKSGQSYDSNLLTCRCTGINQVVDSTNGSCICGTGFVNISNFCIICPSGTVYMNGQCTPTSCQANQVLSNGVCICDQWSVKIGSVCVACSLGTFPNNIAASCDNCISNCSNCSNTTSCDLCASGYVFDYLSRSCIQNAGMTGGISIRSGFPVYTSSAIITDFVVESVASMAFKTRQQLSAIVTVELGSNVPPQRIIMTQNSNNLNTIRVVLDYRGMFPIAPYTVNYVFVENALGVSARVAVNYNVPNAAKVSVVPD